MSVEVNQTRARPRKGLAAAAISIPERDSHHEHFRGEEVHGKRQGVPSPSQCMTLKRDGIVLSIVTAIALTLRLYKIWHPAEVVFDEVHFGKFASYYLRREYFFDVHPPFAKLLIALGGYLVGFKGNFDFETIGDSYITAGVPYISMRTLPAILGSLQVPVVYAVMRETGHAPPIAALSACLLAFDNGHITQDRLILLDATLVFFMILSLYSYIMFYKQRYNEFSTKWWSWMIATGVSLSMTMSCKMVGLLTFMTVGTAVLVDLWNLLDIRRGIPIEHIGRHFGARVVGLIIIPAFVYLFWFWVHFSILTNSGTGDAFMSSQFQETLQGNAMLSQAKDLHYYDKVTLKHKATEAYLHSHLDKYPLKYDDGRISSQGQQVTGYPFNDTNNVWQFVPGDSSEYEGDEIRNLDHVRLLHVNSNSYLMAHDVASPLMATNEEFTTWPADDETRYNDTLFELAIDGLGVGNKRVAKSKSTWFRLVHVNTRVSMWTHTETPLPAWGFAQQEVNGHKNALEKTAIWYVEDLHPDPNGVNFEERIKPLPPRKVTKMNFFKKFFELQMQMLAQNAHLTQSHPYASSPVNWPFSLTGISFWTENDQLQQIYMVGNVASWWVTILSISVLVGILAADTLARRRGFYPIDPLIRKRLFNSTGFFLVAWAWHYLPFYLMNRQLFIHHYLPAHVCGCMVAGSIVNFVGSETIDLPVSRPGPLLHPSAYIAKRRNEVSKPVKMAAGAIVGITVVVFLHLSPLTYGTPGLLPEEVEKRVWLSWQLHFRKSTEA